MRRLGSVTNTLIFLLAFGRTAHAFGGQTCLVRSIENHRPLVIGHPAGNRFEIPDRRLWAYTALSAEDKDGKIIHLWRRKGGPVIDKIERPVLYGARMYSNKEITSSHLGPWELLTLDGAGVRLHSLEFTIAKEDDRFLVQAGSPTDFDCAGVADVNVTAAGGPAVSPNNPSAESEETARVEGHALTPAEAPVDASAKRVDSQLAERPKLWRVGGELGLAQPTGSMKNNIDPDYSALVFGSRRLQLFRFQSYLAIHVNLSEFSGHRGGQFNEARDFNAGTVFGAMFPLTRSVGLSTGLGFGASVWKATAERGEGPTSKNSGLDPSAEIVLGADWRLTSTISFLVEGRVRKTFYNFGETYIPLTA